MQVSLSVIIPTISRDTLDRAIESCAGADQVVVIEDQTGDNGYTARHKGMAQATGTHLAFMDDDDIFLPGAIDLLKTHACDVPVIFRADHHHHGIMWREPVLEFGNVSTQMFVVPNIPEKLGVWEPHMLGLPEPGGDYTFLKGCVEKMGDPIWREEIIARFRPDFLTMTIVTAWRNNPDFAADYLYATGFSSPRDAVVVVDDASEPALDFAAIRHNENLGFSACNNTGLRAAETDAVLFLNSDIVARDRNWLEPIREMLEPGVFVGAQLRYDPHGNVDGEPMPYIDGWCLAGMTEDLRDIGGWDEQYGDHGYYADNDISFRARLAGITLKEARVPIVHLRDTKPPSRPSLEIQAMTLKNKALFEARVREELGVAA